MNGEKVPRYEGENLRQAALAAMFWSVLQSWGGRALNLVVFVVLARLVNPTQYGIAATSFLIMNVVTIISGFGMDGALVQRPNLKREDVNLPFYGAMTISITLSALTAIFSNSIAQLIHVKGLGPYIIGIAAICPMQTLEMFQESLYRRKLLYRPLAIRTLLGIVIGGVVGIGMALTDFGTWALLAQFGTQTLVSVVWLWAQPAWRPSRQVRLGSAKQISGFGANLVTQRMFDVLSQRSVDIIIITIYGPTALGLFTVSSRLYLLLLQLLQQSISSVCLSMLSNISDDRERMRRLYQRTISLAAMLSTPVFCCMAALAPEATRIMFGRGWPGTDEVMVPLLLIGGVHCVQFLSGDFLLAMGKPRQLLALTIMKVVFILPALYFIRVPGVAATAWLYAALQLALSPFMFRATMRGLQMRWSELLKAIVPSMLAALIAFWVVHTVRPFIAPSIKNPYFGAIIFGSIYVLLWAIATAILAFRNAQHNIHFLRRTKNS